MLVLGTAQLGMPYGIANKTRRPDLEEARSIIGTAWKRGIREFDTAQAYGQSEKALGNAVASLGVSDHIRIITKLDPELELGQCEDLRRVVLESLDRLAIPSLYGLMLHSETMVDDLENGLGNSLKELVLEGVVRHVGVSLYSPIRALQALKSDFVDMIQVPANIFDRRFIDAGIFDLADSLGKKVYIRSVFLQGVLLMDLDDFPSNMSFAKTERARLDRICREHNLTVLEASLLYVKQKYPFAKVLFGAETSGQVEQNVVTWEMILPDGFMKELEDTFMHVDEKIIDPRMWPT